MRETGPLTSRAEKTPGNKSEQALKSTVSPARFKGKARNSARFSVFSSSTYLETRLRGGEGGIRTLDTGFGPYNGLANRRLQPLGHLSVDFCETFGGLYGIIGGQPGTVQVVFLGYVAALHENL